MPSIDRAARAAEAVAGTDSMVILEGSPLPAPPEPVLDLIAANARTTPARIALIHGAAALTYGELDAAVAERAAQLTGQGAGPGRLVAIRQPRGIDALVTILATLRTGAAYLPLDPGAPTARNAAILADARGVQLSEANGCEADGQALLDLLTERGALPLDGPGAGDGVAYVIYTSGSTGTPNGVVVGHEALAHFVAGATRAYDIGPDDRVLQFAPLHFDASVEEVFVTLCAGGTLVIRTDDLLDVPALLAGCAAHGITVLDLPTAYWHELAYALDTGVARLPESLRTVIIGGEAALPERVARWRQAVGARVRLLNTYGPTEATVVATVADLSTWEGDGVPIGLPLPGVRAALVEGELWLLGGGLARGYLGRPALTERRFTALGGVPAYRTGDLVCVREDGQLGYQGRIDDEVKISGHRIDPAAVESVLLQHPAIREAAVVVQRLADGTKRLAAYITAGASGAAAAADTTAAATAGSPLTVAAVREHLAAHLPPPAVPGTICVVGALPRTSTGKIDRNLLKSLIPPHGRTSPQDAHDHAPSAAAFDDDPLPPEDRVPLSYAQRRLWFLGRLEGPSATYNVPLVIKLDGVPDREALSEAVADVIERHEALRTVLPAADGEPYQRVLDSAGEVVSFVDCTPQVLDGLVAAFTEEPFDLAVDVPIRVRLFVPGTDASTLVILLHHAVTDGWSMRPLLRDLAIAYQARLTGGAPAWEPLPVQYADYTLWQRDVLGDPDDAGSTAARQLEFWRRALAGLPAAADLPTDRPRPVEPTALGGSVSALLDAEAHRRLRDLCAERGASMFMVFQAGLAAALRLLGAGADVAIGTPVAGRSDEALHDLVGFFVNTLVLRTDTSGDPRLGELVERVRHADLAAYEHQELPFDLLVERLNPPRSLACHPFFQVMLTVEGAGTDAPIPLGALSGRIEPAGLDTAKFDLSVSCVELGAEAGAGGVEVWLQYAADLFDEPTARLIRDVYLRVMRAIAADPQARLAEAVRLTDQEAQSLAARRAALAEATAAAAAGGGARGGSASATSPRVQILRDLFAEVLGVPSVSVTDSFFDLGGHSLLGIRLVNRIHAVLGVEIGIKDLFLAPTVTGLDRRVGEAAGGGNRPALIPIERPERIPLSYAQRRLWFVNQLEGPSADYNLPLAVRLDRPADPDILADALADVAARHEALRTVFRAEDGVPYQVVLDEARPQVVALRCAEGEVTGAIHEAAQYTFDLATEIPLRAWLIDAAGGGQQESFGTGPGTDAGTDTVAETDTDSSAGQYLVLVVHHIAADGWSLPTLTADLAAAYEARAQGRAPHWEPLPVQYADYALWQRDRLDERPGTSGPLAAHLEFWRAALEGAPQVLDLPADRPRSAAASHAGAVVPFELDAATHRRLAGLAAQHGATLLMVLQAALALTLSRLGSGPDVPIGTAVAGRGDEALDDVVGFFVNTLVLRTDTSGDPTFGELLERVRQTDLAAYAHEEIPFDLLVEHLNPHRSTAHHPLVQVMLTLEREQAAADSPPAALAGTPVPFGAGAAKFDLMLSLRDLYTADGRPHGLAGFLCYATDLFDPQTAQLLASRVELALRAAAADPTQRVSDIDLLSEGERDWLFNDYNATTAIEAGGSVHARFESIARKHPDRIAVSYQDTDLTYAETNRQANILAHRLINAGVTPQDAVGILMQRTDRLIIATLAVLKAGAAYVPIGDHAPASRVRTMMIDSHATHLITDHATAEESDVIAAERAAGSTIVIADASPADQFPEHDPAVHTAEEALMYVMFTSGSTGRPKGVGVTHRNVLQLATDRFYDHDIHRCVLVHSPYSFDASTYEIWVPLLNGSRLAVAPGVGSDVAQLTEAIDRHGATATFFTVGLFHILAEEGLDVLARLREVGTGGDVVSPAAVRRVLEHCPSTAVTHVYGPTETTYASHLNRYVSDDGLPEFMELGRPMDNTRAYVLDDRLRPVPPGSCGELYLAGAKVARGYLDRPALTADRFVADPYGPPGTRMYRTGDRVTWTHDHRLRFAGRADNQIKLRGFRIEPGEIEAAITRRLPISRAAIVVREDRPGDKRLVAYVVPRGGAAVNENAVRAAVAEELPDYMVPSTVAVLDALPITANGKLDHAALPAPTVAASPIGRGPRTERERTLCALFAQVLGLDLVGLDDGFFDLGGHSLLATRLVTRIKDSLGVDCAVRDVFRAPTVAGLLALLDGSHATRAVGADIGTGTGTALTAEAGPRATADATINAPVDATDDSGLGDGGVGGDAMGVLLPLNPDGDEPPLFCIHPGAGLGWPYAGLIRHLGADQPLYALQTRSISQPGYRAASVAEIADDYLRQIRRVRPHGPYRLLGWSFGGLVAHAIATRLQDAGEPVELLAMMDSFPVPEAEADIPIPDGELVAMLVGEASEAPDDLPDGFYERFDADAIVDVLRRSDPVLGGLAPEETAALVNATVNHVTIMRAHRPAFFDGDLLFFTAARDRGRKAPNADRWNEFVSGQIHDHDIDTTHLRMADPEPLARIGAILRDSLTATHRRDRALIDTRS